MATTSVRLDQELVDKAAIIAKAKKVMYYFKPQQASSR